MKAYLKRTTFELRKKNGDLVKTYKLGHTTIKHIVGVVKRVIGKKQWITWDRIRFGKTERLSQRYYTKQKMDEIIELAEGQYSPFFTLLASSGVRIGEAAGLTVEDLDLENLISYVRRSFSETASCILPPKTDYSIREIDIDVSLAEVLRRHLAGRNSGSVFMAKNGSPLRAGNIIKRVLNPILRQLGIPSGGKVLHAFRHGRVTQLRKQGIPSDLQKQWIGHSSLRTTDLYSHTDQELEFRREHARTLGLSPLLDPKAVIGPQKSETWISGNPHEC